MPNLYFRPDGTVEGIYSDVIDYGELGEVSIRRASNVEWTSEGWVVLLPGQEPSRPFAKRQDALDFEVFLIESRLAAGENIYESSQAE